MQENSTLKTNTVIIIGIILVSLLAFALARKFSPQFDKKASLPTQTVEIQPTAKQKAIAALPITSEDYLIQYFEKEDKFEASILKAPVGQNVQKVKNWFAKHGIADICSVKVSWSTPHTLWDIAKPADFPACRTT